MVSIFVYYYLMFLMFMFLFLLSMLLNYLDLMIMMEWMMMSVNSVNMEVLIFIDWVSILFISMIFLISSMIMMYSYMYMEGEKFIDRFIYLVILFIMSMILMIISPNVISILFGWDGLGLVSYCLVIYYQNYMSYNSGMVTVLCNRVGDVGLLMGIGLMLMKGSWNLWMLSFNKLLMFMMLVAAITKSAQIPFSTWLPMAMAAPTPVSALVHSSTLVTAGVYLMIRFNKFLLGSEVNLVLLFLSVLTMFMSGLMANVENDLKKIIALSTLSQLGLMMMILSMGMKIIAFYHLLTHALFKSMLFMCAGVIIHSMMNNQDIRLFGNLNKVIPFTMMSFMISSMALCGFPFMAGFYSKDFIMENMYMYSVNIFLMIFMLISLMFTVSYSMRVYYYMFFFNMKFYSYYNFKENNLMNLSMMILIIMSICAGSLLSWMFFYDLYGAYLSVSMKFMTLGSCVWGMIIGLFFIFKNFLNKFYYMNFYISSMWYLNYLYLWMYNPLNIFSIKIMEVDVTWVEFLGKNLVIYVIQYFQVKFTFKMYMFVYFFMNILGWMYLLF